MGSITKDLEISASSIHGTKIANLDKILVPPTESSALKSTKMQLVDSSPSQIPEVQSLHVVDSRTGEYYNFVITHNAVKASDFKRIKTPENKSYYADQNEQGLRIYDPGFSNTVVSESSVTYM